ncbi:LysR substrate-binding domain-containing protein [Agitococcus lubricus]|uniref:LysR family transcriptional regulator n=1 Tax=Agitococcus lubricus TaxID=1077255 RepID=A0A2T5J372_9GAMM|nr:LysR substrate-binding domain-containing protein [Agitococcus lubricus]PTQ91032.1 LysR family transcriptional regulator [Agitococcus lubricus]
MTLTDLRYLVTLAELRHFAKAAAACFVSQPTLSIAIKKLEDELGLPLFERHRHDVLVTPAGERIIEQARVVLAEAEHLKHIAQAQHDEFAQPLRLGAIFTVAPYVFPSLIPALHQSAPNLLLYLEENYTHVLSEKLAQGDLDMILVASPFEQIETQHQLLFEEDFLLLLPKQHAWQTQSQIDNQALAEAPMLMLGEGHCFRDQSLATCPMNNPKLNNGNSLETLRFMVANGLGLTIIPAISVPFLINDGLTTRPLLHPPTRQIMAVWRRRFPRPNTIRVLLSTLQQLQLSGSRPL